MDGEDPLTRGRPGPAAGSPTPSVTIEDVARRAGVSVATVSRALRGLPNVAPATRQRVLDAAADLHYVADPNAARLATGRSRTIGLILPTLGEWFYGRVFAGVEAVAVGSGYDVLPFTVSGAGGLDRFLATLPFRKRVEALVVVDVPMSADAYAEVADACGALVTIGIRTEAGGSVTIDDSAAARLAVGHLTGLGHRRIALIGGSGEDEARSAAPAARRRGYEDALRAVGAAAHPELAVPGGFSLEGGAGAMYQLLSLDEPPTAVFACSDEMAIGALQIARDVGLRVPNDLSIVGFDDHDVAEFVGLTTIRQDVVGQGARAARLLLAALAADAAPDPAQDPAQPPAHVVHPTRLLVRRTTAPAPGHDEG